ncbi:uncharacterized protein [Mytilus edulis]
MERFKVFSLKISIHRNPYLKTSSKGLYFQDQPSSRRGIISVETEMTIELESRTLHANEEMKIPENQINIRSLEVTNDFAMNEKVMGFWKLEKKWYNATVLEKTKSGYKVVFADDNLVRVLGLQNLRQKTSR